MIHCRVAIYQQTDKDMHSILDINWLNWSNQSQHQRFNELFVVDIVNTGDAADEVLLWAAIKRRFKKNIEKVKLINAIIKGTTTFLR